MHCPHLFFPCWDREDLEDTMVAFQCGTWLVLDGVLIHPLLVALHAPSYFMFCASQWHLKPDLLSQGCTY